MVNGRERGRRAGGTMVRRGATVLAVSAALTVAMAACGSSDKSNSSASANQPATTAATVQVTTTVPPKATVATTSNPSLGTIMVDSSGKTLYVFDRDTSSTSSCTGNCAGTWPAVVLPSGATAPVAGTGVTGLSTSPRPDDATKLQVVWNGKPLYTYSGDAAPGQTNGDGFGGVWHVAKAS